MNEGIRAQLALITVVDYRMGRSLKSFRLGLVPLITRRRVLLPSSPATSNIPGPKRLGMKAVTNYTVGNSYRTHVERASFVLSLLRQHNEIR
jgi:hypothetical protein